MIWLNVVGVVSAVQPCYYKVHRCGFACVPAEYISSLLPLIASIVLLVAACGILSIVLLVAACGILSLIIQLFLHSSLKMLFGITILTACLWVSLIFPTFASVHEELASLPNGWTQVGVPADSDTIVLQIGLAQQNLDKLDSLIYKVSTPGSTSYGQYMEADEVAAMTQPSSEADSAVMTWLKDAGVGNVYSDGVNVDFSTSVGTANKLLSTEFKYYASEGVQKLRTMAYSIPEDLVDHIDLVTPTTYFGKTTPQAPTSTMHFPKNHVAPRQVNSSCANLITPACIKELYNIRYIPDPRSGSRIGFGSFLNQSARTQDLSLFETANSIPQQGFSVQLINGGVNDQAISVNHGEANLDVEYIIGTSFPLPVISYITGGSA